MLITLRIPALDIIIAPTVLDMAKRAGFSSTGMRKCGRTGDGWVSTRVPDQIPDLNKALRILDGVNLYTMRGAVAAGLQVPDTYSLHRQGLLRYQAEPTGREWWQTWLDNVTEGEGDCEDLASHQSSFEQLHGVPSRSECIRSGRRIYHAITRLPDGQIEDPSMPLGLDRIRAERRLARAFEAARKGPDDE